MPKGDVVNMESPSATLHRTEQCWSVLMANRQLWIKSYTEVAPQHNCAIDCVRLLAREGDSVVISKSLGTHCRKRSRADAGRRWRTGEGTIDDMGVVLDSIVVFGRSARFSWVLSQARENWAGCNAVGGTNGPTVQCERRDTSNWVGWDWVGCMPKELRDWVGWD